MTTKMDGPGIAAVTVGIIFVYGGIKGYSPVKAFENMMTGKNPNEGQNSTSLVANTANTASGGVISSGGSNKTILMNTAASFGWTGSELTDLDLIEMAEAGYNATAKNSTSGAYGMGQSLGHHTGSPAANGVDEYAGYGLTPAQSKLASMGDPSTQALWMCTYIKQKYGTPSKAWAHEQANHWY